MKYTNTALEILKNIGEEKNVNTVEHCFTRLRFMLKDNDKADISKLEKIEGVIGAQFKGGQLQVIIGTNVADAYQEIAKLLPNTKGTESVPKEKKSIVDSAIDFLSGVFIPIAIALGGAGLIKAILAMAIAFKWTNEAADIYIVLNIISDAAFYFLPFMLAQSTAKKVNVNPYLATTLAGIIMYPTLINGATEGLKDLVVLGLPIPFISYTSSVLPIVLGVVTLKYVFNLLNKFIPKSLEMIITSGIALLITGFITLVVLAPAGTYIGNYVSDFFLWLFGVAGPFAGGALGGTLALLVMSGMAYAFFPVVMYNFGTLGYDYILFPIMILSNINQAVASFAVSLKVKDKEIKSLAVGASATALMGITEPAMYSINLRYKKPFYAALVGSAVAGFLARLFDLKMFSMAGSGIISAPAFISDKFESNIIYFIVCVVAGAITTFVLTFILTKEKDLGQEDISESQKKNTTKKSVIKSVGSGKIIKLSSVPDNTFSSEMIGKGVAIDIQDGKVFSPVDGVVKAIYPTKHAIGLQSEDGVEVLIHIGVDTVKLDAGFFRSTLQNGDKISQGELLVEFDYNELKNQGVYTPTIVIISNTQDYNNIEVTNKEIVKINDEFIYIN